MQQFLAILRSFFHSCYILFPATLLHQPFFHPPSLHFAIYFLVYLFMLCTGIILLYFLCLHKWCSQGIWCNMYGCFYTVYSVHDNEINNSCNTNRWSTLHV
jgi:hypothetical protein